MITVLLHLLRLLAWRRREFFTGPRGGGASPGTLMRSKADKEITTAAPRNAGAGIEERRRRFTVGCSGARSRRSHPMIAARLPPAYRFDGDSGLHNRRFTASAMLRGGSSPANASSLVTSPGRTARLPRISPE